MDALEAIQQRRSVRDFTGDPIPREDLVQIVDAGRLAASGHNYQPWEFIIVTDPNIRQRLNKAGDWMKSAAAIIAVVLDTTSGYWVEDGSAAIENMLIAATALGYGSCWVEGNVKPHEAEFKLLLNIPKHLALLALIPIGVPSRWPKPVDKKSLKQILHWETY